MAEMMALDREAFRSVNDFWRRLKWPSRVFLVLTLALLVALIMSYGDGHGATTDSHLDTFILYRGSIIWKHRSAPGTDLVTATGRWYGLRLPLYLGEAIRIPTRGGQHLWYIEIPLRLLIGGAAVLTSTLMRRDWRKDRAQGFSIEPAERPPKLHTRQ